MQMKKAMRIMGLCCVSALLVACGQTVVETDDIDVTAATVHAQGNVLEQKNKENNVAATWNDSELEEWKQVYLDYLDTMAGARNCAYSLIYVDDDEIPELAIDYGFDGGYARVDGGCRAVLTFHDHVLDQWEPLRSRFTYIERGNRICNASNSYGENEIFHSDHVYMIQDGKWVSVDGGYYSMRILPHYQQSLHCRSRTTIMTGNWFVSTVGAILMSASARRNTVRV